MELNDFELEIQSGKHGEPRRLAIEHQIQIGRFFDAKKLIEISQVHIMADTEALGLSGVQFIEKISNHSENERKVLVPTITDPRGADFNAYKRIKQSKNFIDMELRTVNAFKKLSVMKTKDI